MSYDAYTSREMTAFLFRFPSHKTRESIRLIFRMIKHPQFYNRDIKREKKIIYNECKSVMEDKLEYLMEKNHSIFFSNSLKYPILGTLDNLDKLTKEDLVKFHKKFFIPENMAIIYSGPIEKSKFLDLVNESCSSQEEEPQKEEESIISDTAQDEGINVGMDENAPEKLGDHCRIHMLKSYKTKGYKRDGHLPMMVCTEILRSYFSDVKGKERIKFCYLPYNKAGLFNVYFVGSVKEVVELNSRFLNKIEEGVTRKELDEAIFKIKKALEDGEDTDFSEENGYSLLYNGGAVNRKNVISKIENIEEADVSDILRGKRSVVSWIRDDDVQNY